MHKRVHQNGWCEHGNVWTYSMGGKVWAKVHELLGGAFKASTPEGTRQFSSLEFAKHYVEDAYHRYAYKRWPNHVAKPKDQSAVEEG